MDDVTLVQVVHGFKHLADGLRRILLSELSVLADPVEQFATSG
jgi:hypothetical protein